MHQRTLKLLSLVYIVTNFQDIGTAIGEGIAKLAGYKDKTLEIEAAEKQRAKAMSDYVDAQRSLSKSLQDAADKSFDLSKNARKLVDDFDAMQKKGDSASEAIKKIGKDFDLSNAQGIKDAASVLDKLVSTGKITASEFQSAWSDALKGTDLGIFETHAKTALQGTSREVERLGQIVEAELRAAIQRTGLDFEVISGGMGKASVSAINDTQAMIDHMDKLKALGVDTALALSASFEKGINTADSQKSIELFRQQIESVRSQLGDKITNGLLDDAKQKSDQLKDSLDKAMPGINSVREAMLTLGVKSDESLNQTAKTAKDAFDTITNSGTASAREVQDAFKVYAEKTIAATGPVGSYQRAITEEVLKSEAAVRGLTVSFDSNGKMIIQSQSDAAKELSKTTDEIGRQTAAVDKQTKAITDQISKQERLNALSKWATDEYNSPKQVLLRKEKAGTLSADDLKMAQEAFDAAKNNLTTMQNAPGGVFDTEGVQSAEDNYNTMRRLLEAVKGIQPKKFATGGSVPGTGHGDTVPALLTPGEFVINKTAVSRLGTGLLHALNGMSIPARTFASNVQRFASGGFVQSMSIPRPELPSEVGPVRTVRVELASGDRSVMATVDARDETRLLDILKQARSRAF